MKEKKIVGTWGMINVFDTSSEYIEKWVFNNDGIVYRLSNDDTASIALDQGEWAIDQRIKTAYLHIAFPSAVASLSGYNDRWEFFKLNKKVMIISTKQGGLLTREFERLK